MLRFDVAICESRNDQLRVLCLLVSSYLIIDLSSTSPQAVLHDLSFRSRFHDPNSRSRSGATRRLLKKRPSLGVVSVSAEGSFLALHTLHTLHVENSIEEQALPGLDLSRCRFGVGRNTRVRLMRLMRLVEELNWQGCVGRRLSMGIFVLCCVTVFLCVQRCMYACMYEN